MLYGEAKLCTCATGVAGFRESLHAVLLCAVTALAICWVLGSSWPVDLSKMKSPQCCLWVQFHEQGTRDHVTICVTMFVGVASQLFMEVIAMVIMWYIVIYL